MNANEHEILDAILKQMKKSGQKLTKFLTLI